MLREVEESIGGGASGVRSEPQRGLFVVERRYDPRQRPIERVGVIGRQKRSEGGEDEFEGHGAISAE